MGMLTQRGIAKDILWTLGIFRWRSKGKSSKGKYLVEYKTGFGGSVMVERELKGYLLEMFGNGFKGNII
uniref:Uncharacterized protein n=1 Tax=Oryza meridionalis TaxID=40149 RepID=A0A0E0CJY5_9ORYZ